MSKKVEKIQGMAVVNLVDIPENLADSNETNDRLDVQITFTYKEVAQRDESVNELIKGMDAALLAACGKAARNNTFTYLLDATRLGHDAKKDDHDKVLAEIRELFEGKDVVFTTYKVSIETLLEGSIYAMLSEDTICDCIHNDAHAYTSFNTSYLLVNDDEKQVIDNMKNRVIKQLEDGKYSVGRTDNDVKMWRNYRKEVKAAESNKSNDD